MQMVRRAWDKALAGKPVTEISKTFDSKLFEELEKEMETQHELEKKRRSLRANDDTVFHRAGRR